MEKKKIDVCLGIFDNLSEVSLQKIKNDVANCEIYGVGVYTDDIVIKKFKTQPLNSFEERLSTAKNIEGVDFAFAVDTEDKEKIKEIIKEEAIKYCKQ